MSAVILNEVRKGFYLDSVALMRFSRSIAGLEGVEEAALMMGTPANRQIMADADLLDEAGKEAGGGDLVIGIRARDRDSAERALAKSQALIDRPGTAGLSSSVWRPRSLRAAVKVLPQANLALISVPGDFAVAEARKAIRRGLHAMIFSDNVPLADEAALKREARELGRLVMGPDCGTAIINGTPLAFANKVPRGGIGLIGASGTGLQEVSCLIAQYGQGVSHAIGVGGRDLKSEVGGISTIMALEALEGDSRTERVVLISKPPATDVASIIMERIGAMKKPAVICFIGGHDIAMPGNTTRVFSLKDAARKACLLDESEAPLPHVRVPAKRRQIRGLYSGGTLCAEAQVVFQATGEAVKSNAPIPGVPSLSEPGAGQHLLDLGDDEYTRGRPHPMIDPTVRDDAVIAALKDEAVGVLLVDVVIGYGAHGDPAGHLDKLISENRADDGPVIIASVTGTEDDRQRRSAQIAKLENAGVLVAPTNADAAAMAVSAIRSSG